MISGGAHYNYFRDYDPAIGRYVQSDPIGVVLYRDQATRGLPARLAENDPALVSALETPLPLYNHLYGYTNGSPISFADPKGLKPIPCPAGLPPGATCDDGLDNKPKPQCATAECAAGLGPRPNDFRSSQEVMRGQCKLICGWIWWGPLFPMSRAKIASWGAGQGSSYFGCDWICDKCYPNK